MVTGRLSDTPVHLRINLHYLPPAYYLTLTHTHTMFKQYIDHWLVYLPRSSKTLNQHYPKGMCELGLSKLLKNDVRIFALKKHIYSNIFEFLVAH